MKIVELIRLETNREHGTFGVLKVNKRVVCWTLELPNLQNAKGVSCIPTGQYVCTSYSSSKYKDVYQVVNVPGRTNILLHPGNTDDDTKGCILLGETLGKLTGRRAILNSGKTFNAFRELIGDKNFHLTITEHY